MEPRCMDAQLLIPFVDLARDTHFLTAGDLTSNNPELKCKLHNPIRTDHHVYRAIELGRMHLLTMNGETLVLPVPGFASVTRA